MKIYQLLLRHDLVCFYFAGSFAAFCKPYAANHIAKMFLSCRFCFWLISYYFSDVYCFSVFHFFNFYFLTAVVCVFGSMSSSTTM